MIKLALFFLIGSIIAGLFGFTGISAAAAGISEALFFIFIVAFVVFLILGLVVGFGNLLGRWRANATLARRAPSSIGTLWFVPW